ncbi:MAG: SRPBCC family protein [Pseudomonadota bacterium]
MTDRILLRITTMQITNNFSVASSPSTVWAALVDIGRVAPCFPGARLTASDGDVHSGEVKVKLGPVAVTFVGQLALKQRDDANLRCVLTAEASDRKQRGNLHADIEFVVSASADGADVQTTTELQLTGPVAQYGRAAGLIEKMAARNIEQFATQLAATLREDAAEGLA